MILRSEARRLEPGWEFLATYEKLIGEGTWEDPDIVIRWSGHAFGHRRGIPHDILALHISHVLGAWPLIDQMLIRLYGEMSEEDRLAWYQEHLDDLVEIRTGNFTQNKSVYRWSDKMQFRSLTERFETHVYPELAEMVRKGGGPGPPGGDRH